MDKCIVWLYNQPKPPYELELGLTWRDKSASRILPPVISSYRQMSAAFKNALLQCEKELGIAIVDGEIDFKIEGLMYRCESGDKFETYAIRDI